MYKCIYIFMYMYMYMYMHIYTHIHLSPGERYIYIHTASEVKYRAYRFLSNL